MPYVLEWPLFCVDLGNRNRSTGPWGAVLITYLNYCHSKGIHIRCHCIQHPSFVVRREYFRGKPSKSAWWICRVKVIFIKQWCKSDVPDARRAVFSYKHVGLTSQGKYLHWHCFTGWHWLLSGSHERLVDQACGDALNPVQYREPIRFCIIPMTCLSV